MDIGNADFRFRYVQPVHGGYETKDAKTIRQPTTSELHINSLDRFDSTTAYSQPLNQLIGLTSSPYTTNTGTQFVITQFGSSINGYFNRLAISEINLTMNCPTINPSCNTLCFSIGVANIQYNITIPNGWYTPLQLAGTLSILMTSAAGGTITVTYLPTTNQYQFTLVSIPTFIYLRNPSNFISTNLSPAQIQAHYNLCRMIGAGRSAFGLLPANTPINGATTFFPPVSFFTNNINLRSSDYYDIVSRSLTKYKKVIDTNTTDSIPSGVLARIYFPAPDTVSNTQSLSGGTVPFVMTKQYTEPNWCSWSPAENISTLDFTILDQWGNTVYWSSEFSTEIRLTILLSES